MGNWRVKVLYQTVNPNHVRPQYYFFVGTSRPDDPWSRPGWIHAYRPGQSIQPTSWEPADIDALEDARPEQQRAALASLAPGQAELWGLIDPRLLVSEGL